jgi:hypothetical protein
MRVVPLLILAAACGGSSKPVEQPQQQPAPAARRSPNLDAAPTVKVLGDASLAREIPPPPPKPEKPPAPPIYDRLRDDEGAVAGLTGFSTRRVRDPKRCGGFAILVKRGKKIAPSDAKIAAMFALEFPLGLDFSETKKAGSLLKFNTWVETLTRTAADANTHYQGQFASTDLGVKAAATARLAQTNFRAASVIARAEIPADIRGHEFADQATTAFCDTLAEKAEPLLALGTQALEACQKHTLAAPAGWWAELCKAP